MSGRASLSEPARGARISLAGLAMRNLLRRPARTVIMGLGIAIVAATMLIVSALYSSVYEAAAIARNRMGADAMAVSRGFAPEGVFLTVAPSPVYLPYEVIESIRKHKSVKSVSPQLFVTTEKLPCCTVSNTTIIGYEPDTDFAVSPWLERTIGRPLKENEILAGSNMLNEPGGKIVLFGSVFTIAGKLEPTGMELLDSSVFLRMSDARAMVHGSKGVLKIPDSDVSAFMIEAQAGTDLEALALEIEFENPGVEVVIAEKALSAARSGLEAPLRAMIVSGAGQWVFSLVIVGALFGLGISERKGEFDIMSLLGAKRSHLRRLIVYEALMLTAVGALLGSMAGGLLTDAAGEFMGISQTGAIAASYRPVAYALAILSCMAGGLFSMFMASFKHIAKS